MEELPTPPEEQKASEQESLEKAEKATDIRQETQETLPPAAKVSPVEIKSVEESKEVYENAPEGWVTNKALARKLGGGRDRSRGRIRAIANEYRTTNPQWFKEYMSSSKPPRPREHYSPDLVKVIEEEMSKESTVPKGWLTTGALAKQLKKSHRTVQKTAETLRVANPHLFKKYRSLLPPAKLLEYYSPELITAVTKQISKLEHAPEGWMTKHAITNVLGGEFGITRKTVENIVGKYNTAHPEWLKDYLIPEGQKRKHYSPELVEIIRDEVSKIERAPEGWVTREFLAAKLKISPQSIRKIANKHRESNLDWFKNYRISTGRIFETYSPQLVEIISRETNARKTKERAEEEAFERTESLRHDLESFSKDVAEGKTLESQEFRKLLNMFGSANLFDILYKYRPEFRNIPPDYVKGTIAKYLGDFLIIQNKFSIEDVRPAVQYLSEQPFQDALFEVIKSDCLDYYHREKQARAGAVDREIIGKYITSTKEHAQEYQSPELTAVIDRVEGYYSSLFSDLKKPDRIVEALRPERPFPDLNQVVNMKELSDKKRLLIADEMGLGKSASVILAKEYLGVKCALVVAPSNVLATWQEYLSDKVTEIGAQVGDFRKEQAPRVLVVDTIEALQDTDISSYGYVLVSQEKMNTRYLAELKKCDFGMLIIDEVHKLKNVMTGKRSQAFIELAKTIEGDGKYLALLSGTPVPNKIQDVAMVLKLLYPERFGKTKDKELVASIIRGDIVDLRNLLAPRMQMKSLRQSIELPELREETMTTTLSEKEREIYEILLDDDELTVDQKIRAFRKYVMNPRSVDPTPDIEGSKINDTGAHLREVFQTRRKVVMFVNSYVEGMIRGEDAFIQKFGLPADVRVRIIDGDVPSAERLAIQKEFKETREKVLLVVSGQTADVGVDFSSADYVFMYNEPWTEYDKRQQIAREYRPGLAHDLTVTTSIVEGTIEEGIQEYKLLKYNAIQKVLKGIPKTELEQKILEVSEKQRVPDIEGDAAIAKEWLNSPQNRLHRFFGLTKEIGEKNFHRFLLEHGEEYADCYLDMGGRGFQANTARVAGTLIESCSKEKEQQPKAIRILDVASGPEMLKRHIGDALKNQVVSLDINPLHFREEGAHRVVGSFLRLPIQDKSVDYANLSLALHYTRFIPRRREYERLETLSEMNRVLKTGGRAVIHLIHSLRFKDEEKFKAVASACGFKIVPEDTGVVSSGSHFRSFGVVLEKERDIQGDISALVQSIGPENLDGIKFRESVSSPLRNARRIIDRFAVHNREIPVSFNETDREAFAQEQEILREGRKLIEEYGSIKAVPKNEIIARGFLRIFNGRSYRLLKKSEKMGGFVDVR